MNSVTRYEFRNKILDRQKNVTLDWNRILSFVNTAERNIKLIRTICSLFRAVCCFHQVEVYHFNRPKISNNSLIRDQKSNTHIANRYKKLVHTFKCEAVQFFSGKKPCHKSLTAGIPSCGSNVNCKRDRKAVVT